MRLELRGITAAYGGTVAVRDVTLTVPAGAVVALLGPNGAGKSTLLSVASGLQPPRAGRVLLDDVDVTGEPAVARSVRGLCHVTEGRSIFPSLTVRDNLRAFAPRRGEEEGIERALDAFPRLGERMHQEAGTLSGGEQQMLALARIHLQRPPLVLLDEVSLGLAPIVVDEIFAALREIAAGGTSLLVVEQYAVKALALADLVYVLVRGRLAFQGEPRELDAAGLHAQYLGSDAVAASQEP